MPSIPEPLHRLAEELNDGQTRSKFTPRELLGWFGAQRRGREIVWMIGRTLKGMRLKTEPDFEYAYIDGEIELAPLEQDDQVQLAQSAIDQAVPKFVGAAVEDPTYRIGKLPSANTRPTSVNPNATIGEAVTMMLLNDFSQLPVLQGERTLKGAITWQSLGTKLALGRDCNTVQDCMEEAAVISSDMSLFAAIPRIVEKGYVLVRDMQNVISGIVTTTDLSLQFRQLAEPFLLLGEIENHLRRLSNDKFSSEEVASVKDPTDVDREISDLSDLTFGEHIRLLENLERWGALGLRIDRTTFVNHLNEVKEVRNDVMHFDPDGTAPSELEKLRKFVRLLGALGS